MLAQLDPLGHVGVLVLLSAIVLFIAYKPWKRQRFIRLSRMARIAAPGLQQLFDDGAAPLVLDVKPHHEVIVYCDCPNETSATTQARGFKRVRPLTDGFEAWHAHGLPVMRAPT